MFSIGQDIVRIDQEGYISFWMVKDALLFIFPDETLLLQPWDEVRFWTDVTGKRWSKPWRSSQLRNPE